MADKKAAEEKAAKDKAAKDKAAKDKAAKDKAAKDKAAKDKAAKDKADNGKEGQEKEGAPDEENENGADGNEEEKEDDLTEAQRERVTAMVQRVLSRYDENENGKLDKDEIAALKGRVNFINQADLDGNGEITASELTKTIGDSVRKFRRR